MGILALSVEAQRAASEPARMPPESGNKDGTAGAAPSGDPPGGAGRAQHPVGRFVVRRLAQGVVTLVVVSIVIFLLTSAIPGSPATAILGRNANPQAIAEINHRLGFNKPLAQRYVDWLGNALSGDLGNSAVAIAQGSPTAPVWPIIRSPLADSATLALVTVILLIPLSLLLGVWSGLRAGKWQDHSISTITLILISMPEFVIGALLIAILFVATNLLPPVSLLAPGVFPLIHPNLLVMPVLTLLAVSVAWTVRLVRVGTIEVLQTDYVQLARLHGIRERKVLRRYVLRNALAPSVQIFALSIQYLFGGVIITETVFNYPGIGTQLVQATSNHDNTEVQAIALILAAVYILINIVADLLVMLLVPRLRTAQ
jgi:peptide/nickel transport system permease protein